MRKCMESSNLFIKLRSRSEGGRFYRHVGNRGHLHGENMYNASNIQKSNIQKELLVKFKSNFTYPGKLV